MYCKFCKANLGFNDIIICDNKDCLLLDKIIKKYGIKKILKNININYLS